MKVVSIVLGFVAAVAFANTGKVGDNSSHFENVEALMDKAEQLNNKTVTVTGEVDKLIDPSAFIAPGATIIGNGADATSPGFVRRMPAVAWGLFFVLVASLEGSTSRPSPLRGGSMPRLRFCGRGKRRVRQAAPDPIHAPWR